jgi:ferredoxin--NADP+ reductase
MEKVMSSVSQAKDNATLETVIEVRRWTDTLLTFKTTRPRDYRFVPGQFARLGLAGDHDIIWRAYSVTSAPRDNHLEYYGVIVPGGSFTTILKDIAPGDKIWTEKQSYGFMTVDRFSDGDDLWMLATGTGIGPFISILRDPDVWQRYRNLVLVHGVRHADEFAYRDELLVLKDHPPATVPAPAALQLIQATTRETSMPAGRLNGRITTLLETGELEKKAGLAVTEAASRIMMCGNPAMIEDTRKILHQRGMRPCRRVLPGQFVTENYW